MYWRKNMPRGKRKLAPVVEIVEAPKPELCHHQNKHYTGGEMFCSLEKGHAGNHSDGNSFWSDAAGKPVNKHG
jgi:hypothetical protein